jgi:hypothetical protein
MKRKKLPKFKTLDDFTEKEVKKFDKMLKTQAAYNAKLGTKKELPLPDYTEKEMAEFSRYRQLVITRERSFNTVKEEKVDFLNNKFDGTDWTWS